MLAALLWTILASAAALPELTSFIPADGLPESSLDTFPQLGGPVIAYRCDESRGACVKTTPSDNRGNRKNESSTHTAWEDLAWSQPACQVRCGRAGSLWPLPTGAVRLGAELVAVSGAGALVLPPTDPRGAQCASSPRLVRLLRHAHNAFRRRMQTLLADEMYTEAEARAIRARAHRRAGSRQAGSRQAAQRAPVDPTGVRLDVEVCVELDSLSLDWTTDESYVLEGLEKAEGSADDLEASSPAAGDAPGNGAVIARIRATTFFGARHGLETLSQLVVHTGPPPDGDADGQLVLVGRFSVTDSPAFPHRGLLLDTSRNYYPPSYIRATIKAMAQNKLNVLHWHITDSQSFPYESLSLPQMSAYGAFSARQTYPSHTVRELARFALTRGVRLLPELDVPAHVAAGWEWGRSAGLGDLVVCAGQQPWIRYCVEPPCGQLNPANPNVYRVLAVLFKDMLRDFYDTPHSPTPYFHMGGDEVHLGCWNSSREVLDYMARVLGRPRRRKEDFIALWGHFQERATRALHRAQRALRQLSQPESVGSGAQDGEGVDGVEGQANSVLQRRHVADATTLVDDRVDDVIQMSSSGQTDDNADIPVILWTSELTAANVVDKYLNKDRYVIQLWLRAGDPLAKELVSKGYRVIVSTKDAWYLDHGFGNWKGNSTSGYGYHPWQVAYDNDPMVGLTGLGGDARLVLGGEAAIWSEQADPSGASTKTWPRAAAVAERLWSGSRAGRWTSARIRFVRHRDRMARLGTPSEAVQPQWCTQHEGKCY